MYEAELTFVFFVYTNTRIYRIHMFGVATEDNKRRNRDTSESAIDHYVIITSVA